MTTQDDFGFCGIKWKECINYKEKSECKETPCEIKECTKKNRIPNCTECKQNYLLCEKLKNNEVLPINVFKKLNPSKLVENVFNIEINKIESKHLLGLGSLMVDYKNFWTDLYQYHDNENEIFECLQRSSNAESILLIGPVGSGKTTYLVKNFIIDKNRNSLYMNMKNYVIDKKGFARNNEEAFIFFENCLKESVLINLNRLNNCKKPKDDIIKELLTQIHEVISTTTANSFSKDYKEILSNMTGITKTELNMMYNDVNVVDVLLVLPILYKNGLDCVIIVDNIDELDLRYAGSFANEYFNGLIKEYNKSIYMDASLKNIFRKWDYIISVRNRNIERLTRSGDMSIYTYQITVAKKNKALQNREKYGPVVSINNQDDENLSSFFKELVSKKFSYLDGVFTEQDQYYQLFKSVYNNTFCSSGNKLFLSGVDVFSLCNYSLRLLLLYSFNITNNYILDLMNKKSAIERVDKSKIEIYLWTEVWLEDISKDYMEFFQKDILNPEDCSLNRILLTYLYNQEGSVLFSQVLSDLGRFFNYDADSIKKCLHRFYFNPKYLQSHLINITSDDFIKNYEDIIENTRIIIEPRGEVFIETLLINFDFISLVEGTGFLFHFCLCDAVKLIKSIYEIIKSLHLKYKVYFEDFIEPETNRNISSREFFLNNFTYKRKFYLKRLSSSHIYTILCYLTRALTKDYENGLMLSEEDYKKYEDEIPIEFYSDIEGYLNKKNKLFNSNDRIEIELLHKIINFQKQPELCIEGHAQFDLSQLNKIIDIITDQSILTRPTIELLCNIRSVLNKYNEIYDYWSNLHD